jgi:cyclopropane fatty-acyl-phospholipid synthase-like methyltransferase
MPGKGILWPDGEVEQVEGVEAVFRQWQLYAKLEEHNYLYHREVYSRLGQFLSRISRPFTLLDLGCGDAGFMAKALAGTTISRYTGVDLARMALTLAEKNLALLQCEHILMEKDFYEVVSEAEIKAEVIWIGLSFHHLPQPQKVKFLGLTRKILPDGGCLLMYEPTLLEDESREQFMERWMRMSTNLWVNLTAEELERIQAHVVNYDFPEKLSTLDHMGQQQGFSSLSLLYQDPEKIYTLACLQA